MRLSLIAPAALTILLLSPAAADADVGLDGMTAAHDKVQLTLDDQGRPLRAQIPWSTGCDRPPARFRATEGVMLRLRGATSRRVRQVTTVHDGDPDGYENTVTTVVEGRRVRPPFPSGLTWKGTIRATAVVRLKGYVQNRCRLRTMAWSAGRHQATIAVEGGHDTWSPAPRPWTASDRESTVLANPSDAALSLTFNRPDGVTFRAGFLDPRRTPIRPGRVAGDDVVRVDVGASPCHGRSGEFLVERSRHAPDRRLSALTATFSLACEEGFPPLTGRVTFRRGY